MPIIQTKNLSKNFDGVKAVDGLSVEIERGENYGDYRAEWVGGKTTLINMLSGMTDIDRGVTILNDALKLTKIKPYDISAYGITRTFQDARLFNQMTVLDNILVVLTERNVLGSLLKSTTVIIWAKAKDALEKVNLWEKRNELAINLLRPKKTAGNRSAISTQAEIFLLDEPFAGLFPEIIKTVSGIIKNLRQEGKTVIIIEHNIELIRELCDYAIVMNSGNLLTQGKPEEVLKKKK